MSRAALAENRARASSTRGAIVESGAEAEGMLIVCCYPRCVCWRLLSLDLEKRQVGTGQKMRNIQLRAEMLAECRLTDRPGNVRQKVA